MSPSIQRRTIRMQQPPPGQPLPPGYEIRKKGHFWRNAGIGCAGLIVLAIIIGIAISSSASKSLSDSTSSPATSTSSAPKASNAPKAAAVLLDKTGSGINQTPKFKAAGDWQIEWSYDCAKFGQDGNFAIMVYSGSGSPVGVAANQLGKKGADTSYQHRGGEYYLDINSTCDWHVVVKG
jgi:hypothetical protein